MTGFCLFLIELVISLQIALPTTNPSADFNFAIVFSVIPNPITQFFLGLIFSWWILVPAAINFFITFGADIVEPTWSIERYFDFVLLLMSSTAIAFQLPVLQFILGSLGIITTKKMISNWKIVVISSAILSAVITPSTDPLTMSLLSISIVFLFFVGTGLTYLSENLKSKTLSSSH